MLFRELTRSSYREVSLIVLFSFVRPRKNGGLLEHIDFVIKTLIKLLSEYDLVRPPFLRVQTKEKRTIGETSLWLSHDICTDNLLECAIL